MNFRITDIGLTNSRIAHIADGRARMADVEEDIASGKQLRRPSDDPPASARLMRHNDRLDRIGQLQRNNTNAKLWIGAADKALQGTANSLGRALTLAVQSANDTLGTVERSAIATDIRALSEEIRTLANAKVTGRSIFAGTANAAVAYDAAAVYQGDLATVRRTIDAGEVVDVGLPGPEVYGVGNPGDPVNGNIFEVLGALADAVEAGNSAGVQTAVTSVRDATARVGTAQGRVGAVSRQLDAADVRQSDEELSVTSSMSEIQDTDVAEAIIRLRSAEAGYEATLASSARAMSVSLLDFLR